jgi:hypothetical protein
MPLKFRSNCKTCIAVKADKFLLKRIYESRAYVRGGEDLTKIAESMGLGYQSLYKHTKHHQAVTSEDLSQRQLEAVDKAAKDNMVARVIRSADARQSIIQELYSVLDSDDFKGLPAEKKVTLLLKALKDSDDVSAKSKDQNIDILKMMSAGRSGNVIEGDVEIEYDEPEGN